MESGEPERPAGVPERSSWNASLEKWELCALDETGARQGEGLFYRPDGTLYSRCRFVNGIQEGPFAIYHPDGALAREGRFVGGRADGPVLGYAGRGPQAEPLRACCVPEAAARMLARHRAGEVVREIFFDGGGRPILSDGSPWPPRPPSVADESEYDEATGGWVCQTEGLERCWTGEGRLASEIERLTGGRRALRRFDETGKLVESAVLGAEGERHGPYLRRHGAPDPCPWADSRIREERGSYDRGQAVGDWTFLDGEEKVLRVARRGPAFDPDRIDPRVIGERAGVTDALPEELRAAGRLREALVAAARVAARKGEAGELAALLESEVVPLRPGLAKEWGEALERSSDLSVAAALDALVLGADPASAFRALAAALPAPSSLAADCVEAALLLAPDRRMAHLTRALIRLQHGELAGALEDAAIVELESPDAAGGLRRYGVAAFHPFDDWPGRERLPDDPEPVPGISVAQPLEAVRHALAVYGSRLLRVRQALTRFPAAATEPAWFPPDPVALLADGVVALRRERIALPGEDGAPEGEEIEIDEQVTTEGLGVPGLLALARADWAALSWLCWAVGLAEARLPDEIRPNASLAAAMRLVVTRCWRAHDRLQTGGLLARTNGVPGFAWQGMAIDDLPLHLVEMVAQEYLAIRSMFLWLASAETVSPFQVDLRGG